MARVLVVDDEPYIRFMLRRVFEGAGHDVVASRQGGFPNERAAARFAADETHDREFGIDPGRGDQGEPLSGRKIAVSRQPRAWRNLAGTDVGSQCIYDVLVPGTGHPTIVCMTIL